MMTAGCAWRAHGGVKVQPGRPVRLQVSSEQMAQLQLQIDTASDLAEDVDDSQFLVELLIQAGALTVPHTIQCSRPKPNEVDLYVDRIDPPARARRFGRNGTELRPLVNRTSYFRILLANLSGQDKEIDVALYRIPESDWTPGRLVDEYGEPFADIRSWLFQTGNKRLLPDIEPVAKTGQSMKLPADARPREVDLSPPAVPAADAGESPPVEPPRVAVTNGLACVITNIANPSERWVKWIEVNPLTPRDYVEPHVAYDVDLEEITIDVRGIDADGDGQPDQFPGRAALAEQPIEISWDTTGVVPPGSERNDRA